MKDLIRSKPTSACFFPMTTDDPYKRAWEIKPHLEKFEYASDHPKLDAYQIALQLSKLEARLASLESKLSLFFPDEYPHGQS